MYRLNVKKLGFAFGLTGALIYLGCMIVMSTAGREATIEFFNSLLHGLDMVANYSPTLGNHLFVKKGV